MFEDLTKEEIKNIYLDYCLSKQNGCRCESIVPYAKQYLQEMKLENLMPMFEAIRIVTQMFFEEVANRYTSDAEIK